MSRGVRYCIKCGHKLSMYNRLNTCFYHGDGWIPFFSRTWEEKMRELDSKDTSVKQGKGRGIAIASIQYYGDAFH